MRIEGNRALLAILLVIPLIVFGANTHPASALTDIAVEDFSSTLYKDALNTDVTKWGSGSIELPMAIENMTSEPIGSAFDYITASGDFVYVMYFANFFQSYDVSNPSEAIFADYWSGPTGPTDFWISGSYAYVSCVMDVPSYKGLLQVVNISDPYNLVGIYDGLVRIDFEHTYYISGAGSYVYVASSDDIHTFSVSDPKSPSLVDTDSIGDIHEIEARDSYLYVLEDTDLSIYDLSTPSNPAYHGFCDLGVEGISIFVRDDYAYVGYSNGLKVVDISNPALPSVVATYTTSDDVSGIHTINDLVFLASDSAGLIVVNASDAPSLHHYYTFDMDYCKDVYIQTEYAYVIEKKGTMDYIGIWDVEDIDCYTESAQAQSLSMYTSSSSANITSSLLKANQSLPSGTSISYFLSADDGVHWSEVTLGISHQFIHPGKHLRWKAQFFTLDNSSTPIVYSLNITFSTKLDPVSLTGPIEDVHISDNTPNLSWNSLDDASEYILQLDTTPTFDSSNFINVTTVESEYTISTTLDDAKWYWHVFAVDSGGQRGFVSATASFVVDTCAPEWDEEPSNQVCELGVPFRYDLNASDISGIDHWWVNDTLNFQINATGFLCNKTQLRVGVYGIEIRAYDTLEHHCSESITVAVQDTVTPYWITAPSNQIVDYGESFSMELKVSDAAEISDWTISDTDNFGISHHWSALEWTSTASIFNTTLLEAGTYTLTITVSDVNQNVLTSQIAITVNEATLPTDTTTVGEFPMTAAVLVAGVGVVVVIAGALIVKKGR